VTSPGGPQSGPSRWSALTRAELAQASAALVRLDELAGRQRLAIAHLAAAELLQLGEEQAALEADLRAIFERAEKDGERRTGPATAAERAAVVGQSARVRRAFQHNLSLLSQARRSVSLLLGVDEDRAAYDRRARRLTTPSPARRARAF
jgi:hypothetical protein